MLHLGGAVESLGKGGRDVEAKAAVFFPETRGKDRRLAWGPVRRHGPEGSLGSRGDNRTVPVGLGHGLVKVKGTIEAVDFDLSRAVRGAR